MHFIGFAKVANSIIIANPNIVPAKGRDINSMKLPLQIISPCTIPVSMVPPRTRPTAKGAILYPNFDIKYANTPKINSNIRSNVLLLVASAPVKVITITIGIKILAGVFSMDANTPTKGRFRIIKIHYLYTYWQQDPRTCQDAEQ